MSPYGNVSMGLRQMSGQMESQLEQLNNPEGQKYIKENPEMAEQVEELKNRSNALKNVVKLFDYLESADNQPNNNLPAAGQAY